MTSIDPKISAQEALIGNKVDALKSKTKDPAKSKEAADDFEALFVYYMLQNMRKTVIKSGLFNDGMGGDIMQGLFDQEISQDISEHSKLGIAELIYQQLTGEQEAEAPASFNLRELPFQRTKAVTSGRNYNSSNPIGYHLRHLDGFVRKASQANGVDPDLIKSVMLAESGGNAKAVSGKSAKGLMQLIDSTAAEVGVKNVFDPEENIMGGARYLAKMLERFNGNTRLALAAYNAGPSAVEKYNGIPPYQETRTYVNRVMAYFRQFKGRDLIQEQDS